MTEWDFNDDSKIEDFLKSLSDRDNYVSFLVTKYQDNIYFLGFSELFLFNKFSNYKIIENFIEDTVNDQLYLINLNPSNYNHKKLKLTLHYTELKIV